MTVTDKRAGGDGIDKLALDIEQIKFADGTFNLANLAPAYDPNIRGTEGADQLAGTSGNDTLRGLGSDDVIKGLAGDDFIDGGAGSDQIDGGAGVDTVQYSGSRADYRVDLVDATTVVIGDLRTGTPDGIDRVINVEAFKFADGTFDFGKLLDGNNTVGGTAGADVLSAGGGNDSVNGLAGDDIMTGGPAMSASTAAMATTRSSSAAISPTIPSITTARPSR